jgi:uncharacterized Zn finger protein
MKNKLQSPTKCECGNDTFYIELLEPWDEKIIGVLYQCTECGYIHSEWCYE